MSRKGLGTGTAAIVIVAAAILSVGGHWSAMVSPVRAMPPAARSAGTEPISPIPTHIALDPRKVELGRRLFNDKILSRGSAISCADCHDLARGGGDGRARSVGVTGREVPFNAPTVFNSGFNFAQFWDGRARTLEEQVDGPMSAPDEMGGDWEGALRRLRENDTYVDAFRDIYGVPVRREAVMDAIATYERSLTTPNSRFDRYLRGETDAITDSEKEGYALFKTLGCVSCHQGVNLGGNMFQRLGIARDYFPARGTIAVADRGRYNVTGDIEDMHVFKVPSLRNIVLTAPYLHDGSAASLEDTIAIMGRYQLGRVLTRRQIALIGAFLATLTGEIPEAPP